MSFGILRLLTCVVLVLANYLQLVHGQENAQTRIPHSLSECYENVEIYERDNRLPATIDTLIDLIRKIEDSPDYTQDIRQVAVGLLHRFRMDGIKRAPRNYHPSVLPFSPSEYQFSKHRLLLSRLIPGNAQNFPNNTLSPVERCTLHFLLSSSIETQLRGDESTRCGQLAQFRSSRIFQAYELARRKRYSHIPRNNYLCDIEMSEINDQGRCRKQSYIKQSRKQSFRTTTQKIYENEDGDEVDYDDTDVYSEPEIPYEKPSVRDFEVASNAISPCPVENGVVRTKWGDVAAGPLIAGIAAGLVQQNVPTRELLQLTRNYDRYSYRRQQQIQLNVDNRWAATLGGDLAEVTLLQAPILSQRDSVSVGASGAWNSTTVPHWYFLTQRERLEMTDAEIRGGIDGLILGLNIAEWRRQTSQLRLSQLLDMYYSNRGVLSSNFRSCNRRELFKNFVKPNQLQSQTIAFSTVLEPEMQLEVTLSHESIKFFSTISTKALVSYVENGLNDVCDVSSELNPTLESKTASDLHIFVDYTWQFQEVQPAIAKLLENLDVNRFGTQYTLYNANDGSLIVNTTSSLSDFFVLWNQMNHSLQSPGLNLAGIVKQLREIGKNILNEEHNQSKASVRSFVALIIPQLSPVNEIDSYFVTEQLVNLREVLPELTLLFWSGGSPGRFARFVVDQQKDLFQLMAFSSSGADSSEQVNSYTLPVIQRVRAIPRKVANPRCTTDGWSWSQSDWGSNTLDQFVEPSGVNFYRLLPNYFYRSGGVVRIQSRYQSQIVVCSSRSQERPRSNESTQPTEDVHCRQLLPNENYDYHLSNACEGYYFIQTCPPVFISIQSAQTSQNNYQCSEEGCRFPDEIKYSISLENLGCYSSTSKVLCKFSMMFVSVSAHIFIRKFQLLF